MIKFLHLLGACLFVGNVIVSGFWKALADRNADLTVARFTTRLVNLTDIVFTAVGATLLSVTGHLLAEPLGGVAANPWIVWSYASFGASGLLWLVVLLPTQLQQARLLREASVAIPPAYHVLARRWSVVGVVATLLALPPLAMMASRTPGL